MKKKLLAVAMGAMLAAGAANAVTVNHAGLGDLLVAPSYFIGGGWQDELRGLATAPGAAFDMPAARVNIHDDTPSGERLNFAIYLQPGDGWASALRSELAAATNAKPQWPTRRRV